MTADSRAGFVLAGGKSSRMGHNKALLQMDGTSLLVRAAEAVRAATGSVTIIGERELYACFPYPVIEDRYRGAGPLAGLHAALATTTADWNLVVACDMPHLDAAHLILMFQAIQTEATDCILPISGHGLPEPLCAIYNRRALPAIEAALAAGVRKVIDALSALHITRLPVDDAALFTNINSPAEWKALQSS